MPSVRGRLQVKPEYVAALEAARWAVKSIMGVAPAPAGPGRWRSSADAAWRRKCWVYTAVVGLNVPSQQAAIAAGGWKPWVSQLLREIEDARDDPRVDRLLEALAGVAQARISRRLAA